MILTPRIMVRLGLIALLIAVAQVACFSEMVILGTSPDLAVLVVMSIGLLGGSLTGAVTGFSVGLLIDCLLLELLGAFALTLLAVGYVAGRYRESVAPPTRGALPLLGGGITLLGVLTFAAIQVGIGVEANVSPLVIRDAFLKTLIGAALAIPVFYLVRLLLRPALIDERRRARRPVAASPAESR
ncbi:MAG: rod shape-determining protein MreD [Solirubrobacterales bacterium]